MHKTSSVAIIGRAAAAITVCVFSLAALAHAPVTAKGDVAAVAPVSAKYLTFIDHQGRAVSERDFFGKFLLVFFGYTNCPELCPAGLQLISEAMDELGEEGGKVQPVFITFDPVRDTPKVMADYVSNFHPRLIGLTGTVAQVSAAAKAYEVHAEIIEGKKEGPDYFIDHTALIYLIGPDGNGVDMFDHGISPEEMANEILNYL